MDKKVLRDITYGMYVVTTTSDKNIGCIINTLTQITSENPIITISLNKENYTNQVIKNVKKFAVSIISEQTNPNLISTFGFRSSKDIDKFQNFKYEFIDNLPIIQEETTGYLICEVIETIDCQTHDIFIAKVIDANKVNDNPPMTYKYYHEVIKGQAPKKAPTYIEEVVQENKDIYICDICGYVHEGTVSEDFKCPICGVDASHFQPKG